MTSCKQFAVAIAMIVSALSLSVQAQSAGPEPNHFSLDGISFDYPAGYSVSDESTNEALRLIVTRKGSSVQLTIVALRRMVLPSEMPAAAETFTEPIVKNVALTLGQANSPERSSIETSVGSGQAEGVRLRSSGNRKRTGEVIWLRMNFRLVAMALVRSDADESVASEVWQTVRSSFKVETAVVGTTTDAVAKTENAVEGGVLNGRALTLPKPQYPALARAAHASGTVVVQVLIDQEGNVVSARAVSGHPLLQAVSVSAAREAKFSPTLLEGEPVRVTGVIHYNFVAQ